MKITDPDIIKDSEKDLIDAVKDDLDLEAVKQLLKKRIAATILSPRGGEIVVHNNEIAFRMDFDLKLSGSLMFDRQGNYIPESDEVEGKNDLEDSVSEDLDLDDINITEALEDVGPKDLLDDSGDNGIEDTDRVDKDQPFNEPLEEEFNIDLPEYDLDDELDPENTGYTENGANDSEQEPGSEADDSFQDELVDDDINDILKESRDFWDQKKES